LFHIGLTAVQEIIFMASEVSSHCICYSAKWNTFELFFPNSGAWRGI